MIRTLAFQNLFILIKAMVLIVFDRLCYCFPARLIGLFALLLLPVTAAADGGHSTDDAVQKSLYFIQSERMDENDIRASLDFNAPLKVTQKANAVATVERILRQHYTENGRKTLLMNESIGELAEYLGQFPEVVSLLNDINPFPWTFEYRQRSFLTEVTGTHLRVDKVKVFFDPQASAKLKFHRACSKKPLHCIASPADALLHEFLHVRSVFLDTESFLAQGGMNRALYPYMYEQKIIDQENDLYRAMSEVDHQPRPIRREHHGKYAIAGCVSCIQ
ncbi:hypothetical protein [Teredinibacter sp. KSP-S5-2]|uniref:hypothetical protein n=1 Tax=Teredinibacter sp. KSP-S5-2 TaxID=3034506 RepID=UPI00293418FF|nr:hypothetical protein [Teredinibacter sp. KSP-S5-2]WNO08413.1 hypothetical protein P5V12_15695 [Teredinibacter sp. KSP-S5-2]